MSDTEKVIDGYVMSTHVKKDKELDEKALFDSITVELLELDIVEEADLHNCTKMFVRKNAQLVGKIVGLLKSTPSNDGLYEKYVRERLLCKQLGVRK